jgi:2-dehydropantoate 2-reductase
MKIWVYGAGAVGCYYGSKLMQSGSSVLWIVKDKHKKMFETHGMRFKSFRGDYEVENPILLTEDKLEQAPFKPDLIIVSVKAYSNDLVIANLKKYFSQNSQVPLFIFQNGILSEEIYKKHFGEGNVFRAIVNIAAHLKEPGLFEHKSGDFMYIQSGSDFSELLVSGIQKHEIGAVVSSDIRRDAWFKTIWNAAFNTITALTGQTTKPLLEDSDGKALLLAVMREVVELARLEGLDLSEEDIAKKIDYTENTLGDISTSTLEDVKKGNILEIQPIIGDLVDIARKHNHPSPIIQTIFTLLKLLK